MTFYRTSTRTALQERLNTERAHGEQAPLDEEIFVGAVPTSATELSFHKPPKPSLSTFEIDLMDAWQRP